MVEKSQLPNRSESCVCMHNRSQRIWRPWLCCVPLGLLLLTIGCLSGANTTRRTSTVTSAKAITSSAEELNARNRSLLGLYSSEIESAADKIILESPSPVAQRQALVWKAEAIPVMQTSLLNTDPVAAILDTWVFIFQMTGYMDRPVVKKEFGSFHNVVVQTLTNMNAEMEQLILMAAPTAKIASLHERVSAWADAHPIQAGLTGRRSFDPELIRKVGATDLGAMATLQSLGESLGDLTARLDSYNVYVPKQARWQAELLLTDVTRDPQTRALKSNLASLSGALVKTSSSMERMPDLIGQARAAVKEDVDGQRVAVQAFLRQERLETLDALRQERVATVADMRGERMAATADLRAERQIVLDAMRNQESAIMKAVDASSTKAIQDLDNKGRALIDHFFVRALELMLLTLVLFSFVLWILLRFALRPPDRGEKLYDRAA